MNIIKHISIFPSAFLSFAFGWLKGPKPAPVPLRSGSRQQELLRRLKKRT